MQFRTSTMNMHENRTTTMATEPNSPALKQVMLPAPRPAMKEKKQTDIPPRNGRRVADFERAGAQMAPPDLQVCAQGVAVVVAGVFNQILRPLVNRCTGPTNFNTSSFRRSRSSSRQDLSDRFRRHAWGPTGH